MFSTPLSILAQTTRRDRCVADTFLCRMFDQKCGAHLSGKSCPICPLPIRAATCSSNWNSYTLTRRKILCTLFVCVYVITQWEHVWGTCGWFYKGAIHTHSVNSIQQTEIEFTRNAFHFTQKRANAITGFRRRLMRNRMFTWLKCVIAGARCGMGTSTYSQFSMSYYGLRVFVSK